MKYSPIVIIAMFLSILDIFPVNAQGPGSSPQWVNFWSVNSDLKVGDVVRAYDSAGILCGESFVNLEGSYGFLACALDDPNTPTDEGAAPGDHVHFTVNNIAVALVFTLPSSLYNGMSFQVDLGAVSRDLLPTYSCIDGYESDDSSEKANTVTGPEYHTFYSRKQNWDQDWGKFTAKTGYVYQIQARSSQNSSITHPVLHLYDANGTLLEENEMDKWGRGAEIWWWNGSGKEMTVYLKIDEKNGQFGCRNYTLTVTPWSPAAFAYRFKH